MNVLVFIHLLMKEINVLMKSNLGHISLFHITKWINFTCDAFHPSGIYQTKFVMTTHVHE